jgi:4a-hydroxytetrahydrobiopterin dehydratase
MTSNLRNKTCVPCEVGAPKCTDEEIKKYLKEIAVDWDLDTKKSKIVREYTFKDFKTAINFIDQVADIAEHEGHHPNISLYNYKHVRLELWTHKIGGLHRNDFILASKIDAL